MLILGINGHPNKDGSVAIMLGESLAAAEDEGRFFGHSVEIEVIHLVDVMKGFHTGQEDYVPEWIKPTLSRMTEAHGFILATPVNWFDKSDLMHSFLMHLTGLEVVHDFALEGKVAAALSHCHDDGGLMSSMLTMATFNQMGCTIPRYCMFYRNRTIADAGLDERTQPEIPNRGWMRLDHLTVGQNVVRQMFLDKGLIAEDDFDDWGLRRSLTIDKILGL